MSTCGNPGCTLPYGHVGQCGIVEAEAENCAPQRAGIDWWDCAANQAAQAQLMSQAGSLMTAVPKDPTFGANRRIAELEAENAKLAGRCGALEAKLRERNDEDVLFRGLMQECSGINDSVDRMALRAERDGYRERANALADECGRLRDENTQLLAENARLRRGKPR